MGRHRRSLPYDVLVKHRGPLFDLCRFVVASCALACLENRAAADESRAVRFEVERQRGAEDCPDAAELRKGVVSQLGYDPFRDDAPDRIAVVFAPTRDGFQASIARSGKERAPQERGRLPAPLKRTLTSHANQCGELANSTRLAIAIAIDPQAYLRPPPAALPEPPAAPPPSPPSPEPSADRARPLSPLPSSQPNESPLSGPTPPKAGLRVWLGAGALAAVGAAPVLTEGLLVHASVRARNFSLGAEGRFDWPVTREHGIGTVESHFILGSLVPCAHLGMASACLLGSIGTLEAKSDGYQGATSRGAFLAMFGGRAAFAWALGSKMELVAFADVQIVPTRATLTIDDQPVWATALLTGNLGLQLRFSPR